MKKQTPCEYLCIPWFENHCVKTSRAIGVGRGDQAPSWILKISAKNVVFLISSGKNKFHHFWTPLEKFWKNPLVAPWKNPYDALVEVYEIGSAWLNVAYCLYSIHSHSLSAVKLDSRWHRSKHHALCLSRNANACAKTEWTFSIRRNTASKRWQTTSKTFSIVDAFAQISADLFHQEIIRYANCCDKVPQPNK